MRKVQLKHYYSREQVEQMAFEEAIAGILERLKTAETPEYRQMLMDQMGDLKLVQEAVGSPGRIRVVGRVLEEEVKRRIKKFNDYRKRKR